MPRLGVFANVAQGFLDNTDELGVNLWRQIYTCQRLNDDHLDTGCFTKVAGYLLQPTSQALFRRQDAQSINRQARILVCLRQRVIADVHRLAQGLSLVILDVALHLRQF